MGSMPEVERVGINLARPFIEQWHYSKRVPTGKNYFWGWFVGFELYAVADYGIGVNPYQAAFLSRLTGKSVTPETLVELKRLCRSEPRKDGLPLTAFLSRCQKRLKAMGFRYIVSFSDPQFGHDGGIYKAASFTHLGQTNPENHVVDTSGVIRHRRYAFRHARRNGISIAEAREEIGLEIQRTPPKDRWFKAL